MARRRRGGGLSGKTDKTRLAPVDDEGLNDEDLNELTRGGTRIGLRRKGPDGETDPRVAGSELLDQADIPTGEYMRPLSQQASQPIADLEPPVPDRDSPVAEEEPYSDGDPNAVSNRTTFSNQAAVLADVLRLRFESKMYGRSPKRILRVEHPDGPSTAGGLLARQAISLVPRKGSAPSIVCGWMDVSRHEAVLRSYRSVAMRHFSRHSTEVDISQREYNRFLDELVDIMMSGQMRVQILVPEDVEPVAAPAASRQPAARSGSFAGMLLLFTFALALGMAAERLFHITQRLFSALGR
ncbi:MAG TPA: hypothetical protein VK447_20225 [Myxococcaceae bacterium]|nr:hypothetical protein [Myxococcaceae bacterium]